MTSLLVSVAGGSCTGKTTLEAALTTRLGNVLSTFPFDDMFVGMDALIGREVKDWEDPDLYRWDDYLRHLRDLKAGQATQILARSRESVNAGIRTRLIEPRPVVIVAGFLALHNPDVNRLFDVTIFLDAPEDVLVARRLARAEPGRPWDTLPYIREMLIPGHRRVVLPQRAVAEHVVDATRSPGEVADVVAGIISAHPLFAIVQQVRT